MIEAMACGTPVVAWNIGSVPEIVDEGKTGFIVNNVEQAINAVNKLSSIERASVRNIFEIDLPQSAWQQITSGFMRILFTASQSTIGK